MRMNKRYSDLVKLKTFEERLEYLKLDGRIGDTSFGTRRFLNQFLYQNNSLWKAARDKVIVRDMGCDLGIEGRDILYKPTVHHMNPITIDQILASDPRILDPEYLILTRPETHSYIHFQKEGTYVDYEERTKDDTKLW